ncbi:DUF2379 family protein [Pyxidicoccus parkwayensis]|uniref:DUF2379 family protein n=1 Tax=Pyxidicoccus parkwayensis TaxID=2813578 RepID=A0ABX7NNF1_9BACT|nr:DUSAM domain-containing protein [Pyxidicoccus parkwaysis]QSQ19884.1 DUF2379 family protein [Pyxidicoccus parkwaysis]
MSDAHDCDKVAALEVRLAQGDVLHLSPDVTDLLERVARDVAIPDAEARKALLDSASATTLVREIRHRIREGSRRLMRAISEANRLKDAGDVSAARKRLEDVLTVEVVPLYRQHAEAELSYLE